MVQILLSWFWLGTSAYLWGYWALRCVKRISGYKETHLDAIVMAGLCCLTVYAQLFSLAYKVGAIASAILLITNVIIMWSIRKDVVEWYAKWKCSTKKWWRLLILGMFAGLILMVSATDMNHYDTYLYHAQSIRWIEEYGIVPGLGNLHTRFAYNSAIFPLQALFSLEFMMGRSLHSINGFVVVLIGGYAISSFKGIKKGKIYISDFMRLAIFIYLFDVQNCYTISSPGSDILAMGLVIYIFTKWVDYWEEGVKEVAPYVVLVLLGVYAVSVKLSAAMIVLLAILPAINLIRKRRWKQIVLYIVMGGIIIAPFLIRNVIISGYLIYPYPELDLFSVDWKMPKYTLLYDRNEIKAWGWGLNDVALFDSAFSEWFPVWIDSLGKVMRALFYVNVIAVIPILIGGVYRGLRKGDWNALLIVFTMISCLALWFFGAPLPRYGSVFLILVPAYLAGRIAPYIVKNQKLAKSVCLAVIVGAILCMQPAIDYLQINEVSELKSPDYLEIEMNETILGCASVYYPVKGDWSGYHKFPTTPQERRLQLIELRGESLSDGFKIKNTYKNELITTNGEIHQHNMFEIDNKN